MKGTHPQIISAVFSTSEEDVHTLTIKVSYEYLPEIAESLVFEKREIPADESEQAVIRGMRGHIRGIRDQINSIGTVQVLQGPLDETTDTEIFVKLCYQRTAFTWALNMRNMSTTIVKPQFYYYNSTTKQRKPSGAIPDDGLYVHQNGKGYVEVKFIAELEDFDMVVFSLSGKSSGEYIISSEKVSTLL